MSYNPHPPKHGKDVDIDVDVDVELEAKFHKDVEIDIKKEEKYHKDVDVDVDIKKEEKFSKDVDIDVELIKKDIDVEIDVDKNIWETKVDVEASSIIDGDNNNVNDLDFHKLIDVGPGGVLKMDDFSVRTIANGKSFNGQGNDSQHTVAQSNNLTDNDHLIAPVVAFGGAPVEASSNLIWPPHNGGSDEPFQKVKAEGGEATAEDGIDGNSDANNNDGNGSISGEALASANGIANVSAFTQDIVTGGNQQANFATLDVAGGNRLEANDVNVAPAAAAQAAGSGGNGGEEDGGLAIRGDGNDVNELDAESLINVNPLSFVHMDDFRLDTIMNGESFNGPGNDMQFDVVQVNDILDNDFLLHPQVIYAGSDGVTFQDVDVYGGEARADDGIEGNSNANGNGLDGSVSGSTAATADAVANVSAFTQNIVMGANLQVNNLNATVAGGDSTFADDFSA
jgi:hypothetical protein